MEKSTFILQMELNVLETQILENCEELDIETSLIKINSIKSDDPFLNRRRDILNHFLKK